MVEMYSLKDIAHSFHDYIAVREIKCLFILCRRCHCFWKSRIFLPSQIKIISSSKYFSNKFYAGRWIIVIVIVIVETYFFCPIYSNFALDNSCSGASIIDNIAEIYCWLIPVINIFCESQNHMNHKPNERGSRSRYVNSTIRKLAFDKKYNRRNCFPSYVLYQWVNRISIFSLCVMMTWVNIWFR